MSNYGNQKRFTTKTIVYCALFATMSIVLARILGIPIMADTRISLEAVPIRLAGVFFGPLAGALVGFVADCVGSMLTFGFTPMLCLPPILVGFGIGLFRNYLLQKQSLLRWYAVSVPLFAVAYVFWQSFALTYVFGGTGAFWENNVVRLGLRSLQCSATVVVDVLIIHLLFKAKVFRNLSTWIPKKK